MNIPYDWNLSDSDLATLHELPETEIARRRKLAAAGMEFIGRPSKKPEGIDWSRSNAELMEEHSVSYSTVCKWRASANGPAKRGRKPAADLT